VRLALAGYASQPLASLAPACAASALDSPNTLILVRTMLTSLSASMAPPGKRRSRSAR
jgi:hypothetical protein